MYKDDERMMAWIAKIDAVEKHPNADSLDICTIGGWKCITKLGEYKQGDLVIYISVDSWVPHELAPFLSKGAVPKTYNGVAGARLKTIRLRGQVSQGLILPFNLISNFWVNSDGSTTVVQEGDDVTDILGIQKWEAPVSANLGGLTKGSFPSFIRKTDQERAQNLTREIFEKHIDESYEVTMKLDGSSMTVYHNSVPEDNDKNSIVGICSRNQELKLDQEGNTFVDTAKKTGLLDALEKLGRNIAVQGELMGPGVQGNREGFTEHKFFVFDIFDIDNFRYLTPHERYEVFQLLTELGANIEHIPVVYKDLSVREIKNISNLIEFADGKSINNNIREGLVFKSHDSDFTWKIISNEFLLNGGE